MRRKGVPCGCTDNGGCCGLKEKLAVLWDRTIGSILRINGVSPDGDGDFAIEAGDNINITETGTGNGIRIDTTGGVSYYESGDAYVNVDNNDLEITVNAGVTGGLALQDDLDTVTGAVNSILDGTTVVPEATNATSADSATTATNATNATYLGSNTATVGSDTKPVKIVNGEAVAVSKDLQVKLGTVTASNGVNLPTNTPNFDMVSVTAPISGRAVINIRGGFVNNSTGYRLVGYAKNTTSVQTEWLLNANSNGDYLYYSVPLIVDVNAGDVIHGCAYQTSGSTLNCSMGITMMIYPM